MQKEPAQLFFVEPMECNRVDALPESGEWQYEIKFDGYRAIAVKQYGEVQLAFNEWTPSAHLRHSKFLRLREARDLRKRSVR